MLSKFMIIFITVPLIELLILIKLGEIIGFWSTIALVIVTGIVGATLAKAQGFLTLNKIRNEISGGRIPTNELMDGLLILIGGIVLLTPGILTDIFGFAMLIPPIRNFAKKFLQTKFGSMIADGKAKFYTANGFGNPQSPQFTDDFKVEE